MRLLKLCAVAGLILAVSGTAGALTFKNSPDSSPLVMNLHDYTTGVLYNPGQATTPYDCDQLELPFSFPVIPPEDYWGVAMCDEITDPTGTITYWEVSDTNTELTLMFYGGQDVAVDAVDIDGDGNADQVRTYSSGIQAVVYEDPLMDYDPVQGGLGPAARTGPRSYPTVTNGTRLLELRGAPFVLGMVGGVPIIAEHTNFWDNFNQAGTGYAYFDVADVTGDGIAGTVGTAFDTDTIVTPFGTADFRVNYTLYLDPNTPPWFTASKDPMIGAVPEPATMLAVFLGVSGLAGYLRRRRMA